MCSPIIGVGYCIYGGNMLDHRRLPLQTLPNRNQEIAEGTWGAMHHLIPMVR